MKLKKFEQQPKHVDNIPIEAINLDSEQEQPPKPDKAVGKNVFQPNSKYFTIVIYGLLFVLGAILIQKEQQRKKSSLEKRKIYKCLGTVWLQKVRRRPSSADY